MKTILITGVSKGIGLTLTEYFLEKNYNVIGLGRSAPEAITHPHFSFLECDLLNFEDLKSTLKILDDRNIDIFIHNAMYTPKHAPFIKYNAEDFMNAHALSTVAPTLIIQKIGMGMKKRGYGVESKGDYYPESSGPYEYDQTSTAVNIEEYQLAQFENKKDPKEDPKIFMNFLSYEF